MSQALKEHLGVEALTRLASALHSAQPSFAAADFIAQAQQGLAELELKARVQHIIQQLALFLPADFAQAAPLLQQAAQQWPAAEGSYASFAAWPLIDYVAVYGLSQPELALATLKTLTPLFTAEFAIRAFLTQHFELTWQHIVQWAQDSHPHVRRLASEGLRSRLPWAQRVPSLAQERVRILALLEQLLDDDSDYVRRSVANHIHDLAKDEPELVLAWCQTQLTPARERLFRHALRSQIKAGDKQVLALFGFYSPPVLPVTLTIHTPVLSLGDTLKFNMALALPTEQALVIDYAIYFVKANGRLAAKVFKLKTGQFAAGTLQLEKQHLFKPMTTRRYYAGEHVLAIQVNGVEVASKAFLLKI